MPGINPTVPLYHTGSDLNGIAQIGASFKSLKGFDAPRLMQELEAAGVSFFHLDFLDGAMVRSHGITVDEVRTVRANTRLPVEAHLMVNTPRGMGFYRDLGIDRVIIHHESNGNKESMLTEAKAKGMEAGIGLKPSSPHDKSDIIFPGLSDVILVMATRSGSGGMSYDDGAPERVGMIAELYGRPIEVNSGVATPPGQPEENGSTYKLGYAGATRFAISGGLFGIGTTVAEAVRLNIRAAYKSRGLQV